jgi:hypothetical protein
MLSCPNARSVGLDRVLADWAAGGALNPDQIGFGVLGALHPDYLGTAFARGLEASGHTARASLGAYDGKLSPGFEEALRGSQWAALDWCLPARPSSHARCRRSRATVSRGCRSRACWCPASSTTRARSHCGGRAVRAAAAEVGWPLNRCRSGSEHDVGTQSAFVSPWSRR